MSTFRATDLPMLRAETKAMVEQIGPTLYMQAIDDGSQTLLPDLPTPASQAALLAKHEAARLELSELFYVSAGMAALARAAGESMPSFALNSEDVPSPAGFLVFEEAIDSYMQPYEGSAPELQGQVGEIRTVAACWGPCWGTSRPSVVITFYTDALAVRDSFGVPAGQRPGWRLSLHDEVLIPLNEQDPSFVDNEGNEVSRADIEPHSTGSWMATLKTCWLLMGQTISSMSDAHFDRATRRRMDRLDVSLSRVRVITLRRPAGETGAGSSDREFHHQWIVRGHWRQQWLPSRGVHRPTWIAPHIKGPEGAPLLGGEKVYALKR